MTDGRHTGPHTVGFSDGSEVLTRPQRLDRLPFTDAHGKLVPPGAFLGVAERLGLIHAIDRWVIREALRALAARPEMRLGVNISGHSEYTSLS